MTHKILRVLRDSFTPPMLVALLALAMSMGGTAYAAHLITSHDIKNNSIKSIDIKNGTIQLSDMSGAAKAALSQNWDPSHPLVSGKSITGEQYFSIDSSAAGEDLDQTVHFPALAPKPMTAAHFAPDADATTTDDDPSCTGTYNNPTAPAGMVCAYEAEADNITALRLDTLYPGQNKGFIIRIEAAASGPVTVDFSWAYTAP